MKNKNSIRKITFMFNLRRLLLTIGFLLTLLSPVFAQQVVQGTEDKLTGWRKITSYTSGFESLMPGPATLKEELLTEDGVSLPMRTFETTTDFGTYAVGVIDMSSLFKSMEGTLTPKTRDLLFEFMFEVAEPTMIAGLPKTMRLERMEDAPFNGAKGRKYLVKLFGNTLGEMRLVHHKERVFFVMGIDISDDRAANLRRFYSSIRFL
jgi:hypothetical protein